ncbi:1,4-alpha-glucan branching protein [Streptomyces sp. N35]|uniref:maltokinase N-terminal cap-like domain-containing protein n=1 Tax=Streptomyces sp. N35 TaxID=2795730 RepID=UPI0018F34B72|nr:1,4-alpha-glucan branching protein [Streptomyces sp. N35]
MAEIHHTTLKPTKLELLTDWLPGRPWYRGGPEGPRLSKAGGFRLDDPEGGVGIEFMVVSDAGASYDGAESSYLVPMTYRGAPLQGADEALIGTTEHGVLGKRWVYDGCHDPVLVGELAALIDGRAKAQAQSVSDQEDRDIRVAYEGAPLGAAGIEAVTDTESGTGIRLTSGTTLRLVRALAPGGGGHVTGVWQRADASQVRAPFVIVHPGA